MRTSLAFVPAFIGACIVVPPFGSGCSSDGLEVPTPAASAQPPTLAAGAPAFASSVSPQPPPAVGSQAVGGNPPTSGSVQPAAVAAPAVGAQVPAGGAAPVVANTPVSSTPPALPGSAAPASPAGGGVWDSAPGFVAPGLVSDLETAVRSCDLLAPGGVAPFGEFSFFLSTCALVCHSESNCDDTSNYYCGPEDSALELCLAGCEQFECEDGQPVPSEDFCDGLVDCSDGSDERGCAFHCQSGETVDVFVVCDRVSDCVDGSDEQGCAQFQCF